MNYLSIDYGKRRMGFAISSGELARPLKMITYATLEEAIEEIIALCRKETVSVIVLGFPASDTESEMACEITQFKNILERKTDIPIIFQDETLTSAQARNLMAEAGKRKTKRRYEDAFAAAIILQSFLDSQKDSQ